MAKLYAVSIEFGQAPFNVFLPSGLNIFVGFVLEAFQQEPSQDGAVMLIELRGLSKQLSHRGRHNSVSFDCTITVRF
jgi:hypothetical protein